MNRLSSTDLQDALGEALPHPLGRAMPPGSAAALTLALSAVAHPAPVELSERLLARVAASSRANAGLLTLRQPSRAATQAGWPPGVRAHSLREQTWLVELDAGAELPTFDEGTHELLVLEGSLQGPSVQLAQHNYLVCSSSLPLQAQSNARIYLRRHGPKDPFQAPSCPHTVSEPPWQPLREGVDIAPLYAANGAVTMLARFAAGARVPAHPHGIDEECLMVEGDLFLGDVLLPKGGFQFAPGGSQHGDLTADGPCLLFFHGAVDAAAIDNGYRASQGWAAL